MNAKQALDRADELIRSTWVLGNNNWSDREQVAGIVATMRRNLEEAQAAVNKARAAVGLEQSHDWPFNKVVEVKAARCEECGGEGEITCPGCYAEDSDCESCRGCGVVSCPECS